MFPIVKAKISEIIFSCHVFIKIRGDNHSSPLILDNYQLLFPARVLSDCDILIGILCDDIGADRLKVIPYIDVAAVSVLDVDRHKESTHLRVILRVKVKVCAFS